MKNSMEQASGVSKVASSLIFNGDSGSFPRANRRLLLFHIPLVLSVCASLRNSLFGISLINQSFRMILLAAVLLIAAFAGGVGAGGTENVVRITAMGYDRTTGEVSVSFTSESGKRYSLEGSNDLHDWSQELVSLVTGADAMTTIEGVLLPPQAGNRYFLRVRSLGLPLEMVTVGDPGNDPDLSGFNDPIGAVNYQFQIGKFEVTNRLYVEFLNSVAAADPNELYSDEMNTSAEGGITRSGDTPNFTYQVKPGMADKPVNHVSWYDTLRFCNWLHHGRPTGGQNATTTEDGAYSLTGPNSVAAGTDPIHGANGRNQHARFHLPSRDEWHKAAYHEEGANEDSYWFFPTRSDVSPVLELPPGGSNSANYDTVVGTFSAVGAYGESSSFHGTFDQGGNASEWTEHQPEAFPSSREVRGGAWFFDDGGLRSNSRDLGSPASGSGGIGFRVAAPAS